MNVPFPQNSGNHRLEEHFARSNVTWFCECHGAVPNLLEIKAASQIAIHDKQSRYIIHQPTAEPMQCLRSRQPYRSQYTTITIYYTSANRRTHTMLEIKAALQIAIHDKQSRYIIHRPITEPTQCLRFRQPYISQYTTNNHNIRVRH